LSSLVALAGKLREKLSASETIAATQPGVFFTRVERIFTRGALDFEINMLTAFERTLAVHTDLAAAGFDLVLNVAILVKDFVADVEALIEILDFTEVVALSVFNVGNSQFRSVEAVASALAVSVE